jgi:hypothetical protein
MQNYYSWRKQFGGLKLDQAKRLKELERGADRDRELASRIQHETAHSATGHLQPQSLGGESIFTTHGCEIKTFHFFWTNKSGRSSCCSMYVNRVLM